MFTSTGTPIPVHALTESTWFLATGGRDHSEQPTFRVEIRDSHPTIAANTHCAAVKCLLRHLETLYTQQRGLVPTNLSTMLSNPEYTRVCRIDQIEIECGLETANNWRQVMIEAGVVPNHDIWTRQNLQDAISSTSEFNANLVSAVRTVRTITLE